LPAAHVEQLAVPARLEYVPAAQDVHTDALASEYVPIEQFVHAVKPLVPPYVPAAHELQTREPADAAYLPVVHWLQEDEPALDVWPAAHCRHADAPLSEYDPSEQYWQPDAPADGL
jgi:hypothetical protein